MKKLLLLFLLFIGCNNPNNHGNLSIFKDPSPEQFAKWIAFDSVYIKTVLPMVNVYKGSSKLNFNGNPWENRRFHLKYSELTWRGLYDYVNLYSEVYNKFGFEEGEKILDSINNIYDQMRDELIIWKEE